MADWSQIESRGNVDDRRGAGPMAIGGMGGLGLIGTIIVLAFALLGGSPDPATVNDILSQLQQTQVAQQNVDPSQFEGADSYETFASAVLGSNNDLWRKVFQYNNLSYTDPTLVLYRGATQTGCGLATSDVGPFYCPTDTTIYLDETFFDELQRRFGAQGGDVAEAYVIAHEAGHHAQNLMGRLEQPRQSSFDQSASNEQSVKLELQADCFAGLWAYSISNKKVFEKDEINEARDAASAVGDDRIQQSVTGQVNPETWTHGSSQQRQDWFNRGYESGHLSQCNTG